MYGFAIGGKSIYVFPSAEPDAPVIYRDTCANEGQQAFQATQAANCPPFTPVTAGNLNWNHDMVTWDSPAAFRGGSRSLEEAYEGRMLNS